jgi:hypothetical protein
MENVPARTPGGVRPYRLLVVVVVAALALTAAACGGDGDGDSGGGPAAAGGEQRPGGTGGGSASAQQPRKAPPETEPEKKARGTVEKVYDALGPGTGKAVDAKAVCDLMTEKARKETADYVRIKDATCEQAFTLLLRRTKNAGTLDETLKARVIGVNVQGDRATATVQFGPDGAATAVPLVKEDGEWKLGGSLTGGQPAPKGKGAGGEAGG